MKTAFVWHWIKTLNKAYPGGKKKHKSRSNLGFNWGRTIRNSLTTHLIKKKKDTKTSLSNASVNRDSTVNQFPT